MIGFYEFIQNKVILRNVSTGEKLQDFRLTNMYVISPSLQPSRATIIAAEKLKNKRGTKMVIGNGRGHSGG